MQFLSLHFGKIQKSKSVHYFKINETESCSEVIITSKSLQFLKDLPLLQFPSNKVIAYKDPNLDEMIGPTAEDSIVYVNKQIHFETNPSGLVFFKQRVQHTPITIAAFNLIEHLIEEKIDLPFEIWLGLIENIDREWD